MKKCRLSDFKRYCLNLLPEKYYVEVKYCIRASFDYVEFFFMPDAIRFSDKAGNCLCISGVTSVYHDGNSFVVYSDFYGVEVKTSIKCSETYLT